jgi:transposase
MGYISNDREQLRLDSYSLSDFVEKDSKARFIVEIVSRLDKSALYSRYSSQGADAYEPSLLLSAWFLAYSEGVTSSRKLEELCKKHMDYIYISANVRPDHCSLSRFRKQHLDLMSVYFIEIVKLAAKRGIPRLKEIAIDGSKIPAVASKKQCRRSYEIDGYLSAIKRDISSYWTAVSASDSEQDQSAEPEEGQEPAEAATERQTLPSLNKELEKLLSIREQISERQKAIEDKGRRANHQITLSEPEAYMMDKGYGRGHGPAYNVQLGIDIDTQLIVHQTAVQDRNDEKQINSHITSIEAALGKDKDRAYVADSGYHSFDEVERIIHSGITAYVDAPYKKPEEYNQEGKNPQRFDKKGFRYEKASDQYRCPNNRLLKRVKRREKTIVYRADDCSDCPMRQECIGSNKAQWRRNQKIIYRDIREDAADIMYERVNSNEGQRLLERRKMSIEPVFGNIKSNKRFDRFHLKGLAGVRGELALVCIGHNLDKLFAILGGGAFYCHFLRFIRLFRSQFSPPRVITAS